MKRVLGSLTILASAITLSACGANTSAGDSSGSGSDSSGGGSASSGQCIILANGGRTLCGSDAAAWCRATDEIRQTAINDPYNTDTTASDSQDTCTAIEANN